MDALGAEPIHALQPHRALFIPEILRNILEYTDPHDDPGFALVCRQWLEPALNAIWNKLGDNDTLAMFMLFKILERKKIKEHLIGDNQPSEQEVFFFNLPVGIGADRWSRFLYYAPRIREMFFSLDNSDGTYLDHSVFLDFATSRTVQTPLKNLRRLDVNVGQTQWSMKILTLFLHERLESLTIRDPSKGRPHSHLAYLLSETAIRADKLTSLILHVHCSAAELGPHLRRTLPSMRNLKTLQMQSCLAKPTVLQSLAKLPELRVIRLIPHPYSLPRDWPGCTDIDEPYPQEASTASGFSALEELAIQGSLVNMTTFFVDTIVLEKLSVLCVDMLHINTGASHLDFVHHVLTACPNLNRLEMARRQDLGSAAVPTERDEPISVSTLQQIHRAKHLQVLHLSQTCPSSIADIELVGWATEWRDKQRTGRTLFLDVVSEPISLSRPELTLRALRLLAISSASESIAGLQLYVRTDAIPDWLQELKENISQHGTLPNLKELRLTMSPLEEEHVDDVALYLSQILPPTCNFVVGTNYVDVSEKITGGLSLETINEIETRRARWTDVAGKLGLLQRAQRLFFLRPDKVERPLNAGAGE